MFAFNRLVVDQINADLYLAFSCKPLRCPKGVTDPEF